MIDQIRGCVTMLLSFIVAVALLMLVAVLLCGVSNWIFN